MRWNNRGACEEQAPISTVLESRIICISEKVHVRTISEIRMFESLTDTPISLILLYIYICWNRDCKYSSIEVENLHTEKTNVLTLIMLTKVRSAFFSAKDCRFSWICQKLAVNYYCCILDHANPSGVSLTHRMSASESTILHRHNWPDTISLNFPAPSPLLLLFFSSLILSISHYHGCRDSQASNSLVEIIMPSYA